MADFTIIRDKVIAADPARLHALINDFREWLKWSPWEGLDPDLHREYSGAEVGVGSRYAWSGNNKAGSGNMSIVSSAPGQIGFDLAFLKPFKATNKFVLALTPVAEDTKVTWTMTGQRGILMAILARVMNLDESIGKDFEKGLAQLKAVAESDQT